MGRAVEKSKLPYGAGDIRDVVMSNSAAYLGLSISCTQKTKIRGGKKQNSLGSSLYPTDVINNNKDVVKT